MKKIVSIAIVIVIGVTLFLNTNSITVYGTVEDSGYVILDDTISANFAKEELSSEDMTITPYKVESNETIYEKKGEYYIGEDRVKINNVFPVITNNGNAINIITNLGILITDDFIEYETFPNIFLSNGSLYQGFTREKLDDNNYILYALANGLYMNTMPATIVSNDVKYELSLNSIVQFEENMIKVYSTTRDVLSYRNISELNENTKIILGDKEYNYSEFLKTLNKINEEIINANKDKSKNTEEISNGITDKNENSDSTEPNDKNSNIGANETNGATGTNGSNGAAGTNGTDGTNGTAADVNEPDVVLVDVQSKVYSLLPSFNITDQSESLLYPIDIKVYEGEKLTMRKSIKKGQDISEIELTGLKPSTEYELVISYNFTNSLGKKVEREIKSSKVRTRDISELGQVSLSLEKGEIFENYIQLKNISMTSEDPEAIRAISTIGVIDGSKTIGVISKEQVELLQNGDIIKVFDSIKTLDSNTEFNLKLVGYDRHGNEIPLKTEKIQARTSKAIPTMKIINKGNDFTSYDLEYSFDNKDNVNIENKRYEVVDSEGNVEIQGQLPSNGKLEINNLYPNTKYSVLVYGDYDLDDNEGLRKNNLMGELNLKTQPLSSLGAIYSNIKTIDATDNSVVISVGLDNISTNAKLIDFIDKVSIVVNQEEIFLTEEQIEQFKNNESVNVNVSNLKSATVYSLEFKIYYKDRNGNENLLKTMMSESTTETLKKEVKSEIKELYTLSDKTKVTVYVRDEDSAIKGNQVTVVVKNEEGKKVDSMKVSKNKENKGLTLRNLSQGQKYTIEVVAGEFNLTSDTDNVEKDKVIQSTEFIFENSVSSKFKLNMISENEDGSINLDFDVDVEDKHSVLNNSSFAIEEYKGEVANDGTINYTLTNTYDYTTSNNFYNEKQVIKVKKGNYMYKLVGNIYGEKFELYSPLTFTANKTSDVISEESDFSKVLAKPDYNYLVINDIDLSMSKLKIIEEITGTIDFDGNTLTLSVDESERNALFSSIGESGKIKNLKLNLTAYRDNYNGKYGLVEFNRGTISDIQVTFNGNLEVGAENNEKVNSQNTSAIAKANYGRIENFIIKVNKSVSTSNNLGLVTLENYGTVKNGYIYGDGVILLDSTTKSDRILGGVVATNYYTGTVEGVYSYIKVNGSQTKDTANVGSIIGKNLGTVTRVYGEKIGDNLKQNKGPAVGESTGTVSESYYYSSVENSLADINNTYNKKIQAISLKNNMFVQKLYDKNVFDLDEEFNYYPKLKNNDVMTYDQADILVPTDNSLFRVAVVNTEIIDKTHNTAKLVLDIKNLKEDIVDMDIPNVTVGEIDIEKNGNDAKVTVNISANKHYENYYLRQIRYKQDGEIKELNFEETEMELNFDFYKVINSVEQWNELMKINEEANRKNEPLESLALESDLDLKNIVNLETNVIIGKLNGNGRTIKNLTLTLTGDNQAFIKLVKGKLENINFKDINIITNKTDGNQVANKTGLIYENKGEIKNVNIENVNINKDNIKENLPDNIDGLIAGLKNSSWNKYFKDNDNKASYSGLIVKNYNKIDNINMKNCTIVGFQEIGGLVVENVNNGDAIISNILSNGNTIVGTQTNENGKSQGGIVAYNYARIENVDVSNNKVISGSNRVGGIIGLNKGSNSVINNLYTSNSIVFSLDKYVGGIVAFSDRANFLSVGSNNSHVVGNYYVGGLAGNVENLTFEKAFVNGGSVRGVTRVGGILGTNGANSKGDIMQDVYAVTDVYAKGHNEGVGSIVGYFKNGTSSIQNAYVGGTVNSEGDKEYVGILGVGTNKTSLKNILNYATYRVKNESKFSYKIGDNSGKSENIYVWEGSSVNEKMFGPNQADSIVTEQLKTKEFYTDKLGLSQENWSFRSLPVNMPKIIFNGTLLPNQPDLAVPVLTESTAEARMTNSIGVYTVGADNINLEFPKSYENMEFEVFIDDEAVVKQSINKEVFTFKYDFVSDLKIKIKDVNGNLVDSYEVIPNDINRSVLLQGDKYYYITSEGIKSDDKVIPGDFVNIYKGEALTRNGDLINIETGEVIESGIKGIKLLDAIKSIFEFTF